MGSAYVNLKFISNGHEIGIGFERNTTPNANPNLRFSIEFTIKSTVTI